MTDAPTPPRIERDDVHTVDDERFTTGNVCLVTGAASGIGRAVALVAATNGLTVVATDVDGDGLDGTAARATELNADGAVETVTADLRIDGEMDALVDAAAERGRIRFLANVAGLQHVDPLDEFGSRESLQLHPVLVVERKKPGSSNQTRKPGRWSLPYI